MARRAVNIIKASCAEFCDDRRLAWLLSRNTAQIHRPLLRRGHREPLVRHQLTPPCNTPTPTSALPSRIIWRRGARKAFSLRCAPRWRVHLAPAPFDGVPLPDPYPGRSAMNLRRLLINICKAWCMVWVQAVVMAGR
jgi:hypothetical protein